MRQRLWVVGVLGGLAAVVALAAFVLQFGMIDPSPPSLEDDPVPAIPGRIAYVDTDSCIMVADASGAARQEAACGFAQTGVAALAWLDGNTLAYAFYQQDRLVWTAVDLAAGEERSLTGTSSPLPKAPGNPVSPLGERIEIEPGSNDVFVIDGAQRTHVFEFDGPESAWLDFATWSPGGEWVLLHYGRDEELWIVQRTGKVAGTLATDANYGPVSWWIDGVGVLPDVDVPGD